MEFNKEDRTAIAWHVYHDGMIGLGPDIYNAVDETPIYYADTASKAKTSPSEVHDYDIDGRDAKYTDIKVKRAAWADKYLFEGNIKTQSYIENILAERKLTRVQVEKINAYPADSLFYIQNGYVGNSVSWWGLNGSGYTCKLEKAQSYTKAQILDRFIPGRPEDRIWLKSHIDENTTVVVDGQHINAEFCITKY